MKTVAILGNASRTRGYAPFDNPDVEIWAMTIHALKARRCEAVLEMHPDVMTGERWEIYPDAKQYREWLKKTKVPVWMHEQNESIGASVKYPRELIEEKFIRNVWKGGQRMHSIFGGTASYGMGLALFLGFERIELYGIELNSRPEYDEERDCLFFWVGRAEGLGVAVAVHEESRLFGESLYPFERTT